MPKVAIAESLSDWEGLITSASGASLDDSLLGEHVEELRALLKQAKKLHARRQRLEGERRATAQALAETTEQAKTVASRIRSKLKGVYGPASRQLVAWHEAAAARPQRCTAGALLRGLQGRNQRKRVDGGLFSEGSSAL